MAENRFASQPRSAGVSMGRNIRRSPQRRRDLGVQRVIVFLDLLSTSRPHDQSDRDIRRQRELKRGTQIHAVAGGDRSKLLALFDDDRRNFEIILSVVVTRALEDGSRWQIFPGDLDVTL